MGVTDTRRLTVSDKGLAVLAAIDSGLIPKTETGADISQFETFWSLYQENLAKHRLYQLNDLAKVLDKERQERAGDRAYYRSKYRNLVIGSYIGALLGVILTKLFQML